MDLFKGQNLLEFSDRFKTDNDCKDYLASIKAKTAFKCSRCNHTACKTRDDFSRQCNICRHTETATADTLFHTVKFGVRKAFLSVLKWPHQPRVCQPVIWEFVMV